MPTVEPLTEEQAQNWRNVLVGFFGDYALIMPVEQIEAWRVKLQENADELALNEDDRHA